MYVRTYEYCTIVGVGRTGGRAVNQSVGRSAGLVQPMDKGSGRGASHVISSFFFLSLPCGFGPTGNRGARFQTRLVYSTIQSGTDTVHPLFFFPLLACFIHVGCWGPFPFTRVADLPTYVNCRICWAVCCCCCCWGVLGYRFWIVVLRGAM